MSIISNYVVKLEIVADCKLEVKLHYNNCVLNKVSTESLLGSKHELPLWPPEADWLRVQSMKVKMKYNFVHIFWSLI